MRTRSVLFLSAFSILYAVGLFSTASAQTLSRVNQYTAQPFKATWVDISMTGDTFHYNQTDLGWGTISMPFDFPYDGTIVTAGTKIKIGACCGISLSSTNPPNGPGLDSAQYPGLVCVFSAMVVAGLGHATPADSDYFEVDGSAPNRVLTVQYHYVHMGGTGTGGGSGGGGGGNDTGISATMMQVKFFETTGEIDFIYLKHNNLFEKAPVSLGGVGLNGFSTPSFVANEYETKLTATPDTDIRWIPTFSGVTEQAATTAGVTTGNCYPNPAQDAVSIPITLAEAGTLRIEIRDASGALVATDNVGNMSAGEHTVELGTKDLPSGSFFCTAICGQASVTRHISIVR